uniref:Uncharacterized protein n=1 Tax=Tetranychus urticae TaxID=32264 RepID=T1KHG9_TETUR
MMSLIPCITKIWYQHMSIIRHLAWISLKHQNRNICVLNAMQRSFEQRTTLSKFEGSNAISSDDYFGRSNNKTRSGSYTSGLSNVTANLYDVKEGVRDGVSRVAGRLSSLATDVMSSFQVCYTFL